MQLTALAGLGFYNNEDNLIQYVINSSTKKIKKLTDPLSTSLPIHYFLKIGDKSLKLASHFHVQPFLPILARSLEGVNDMVSVGNFINLSTGIFPALTDKNLDESKLLQSLESVLIDSSLTDKQKQKLPVFIVNEVKSSLVTCHTMQSVKVHLEKKLQGKYQAHIIAKVLSDIKIQSKTKTVAEKVYTFLFVFGGGLNVTKTMEKWGLFDLAKISQSMGQSKLGLAISKVVGSKVTKFVAVWSIKEVAKFAILLGTTVKLFYDVSKFIQNEHKIYQLKSSGAMPPEYGKLLKERTDKIWAITLGVGSLLSTSVPMLLAVNPGLLLTYEVGLLALGLVNVLR